MLSLWHVDSFGMFDSLACCLFVDFHFWYVYVGCHICYTGLGVRIHIREVLTLALDSSLGWERYELLHNDVCLFPLCFDVAFVRLSSEVSPLAKSGAYGVSGVIHKQQTLDGLFQKLYCYIEIWCFVCQMSCKQDRQGKYGPAMFVWNFEIVCAPQHCLFVKRVKGQYYCRCEHEVVVHSQVIQLCYDTYQQSVNMMFTLFCHVVVPKIVECVHCIEE